MKTTFYFEQYIDDTWVKKGNIPNLIDGYEVRIVDKLTLFDEQTGENKESNELFSRGDKADERPTVLSEDNWTTSEGSDFLPTV